jgi:ketosteroid isomerase-like protein
MGALGPAETIPRRRCGSLLVKLTGHQNGVVSAEEIDRYQQHAGPNQPPRPGTSVAGSGRAALDTALAYYRAWTSHDFDKAMTYVDEDIVCHAPAGRLDGAAAFRGFMGPFVQIVTSSSLIAAFGDDKKAVVMYDTGTVPVKDAPGAECVTVRDGKITHMRIIFDRLPFDEARRAAATG